MIDTVRVPREPTEAMLDAFLRCIPTDYAPDRHEKRAAYAAMLAASPQGEGSSADAHTPQPDAPGWRDIATAPRDGTAFMVWWPHWYHFPLIAYIKDYRLRLSDSTQPAEPWEFGTGDGPTHWQPLPPPPSADNLGGDVAKRSEPKDLIQSERGEP